MSIFTLTTAEVVEVRSQVGAYLTTDDLTDVVINSESILGAASDYCYERLLDSVDPTRVASLPANEQAVVTRARDATAENVTNFINTILKPPQQAMFRRAIVFRTAGMCVPIVRRLSSETAGVITQNLDIVPAEVRQQALYNQADAEIDLVRSTFPDDVFKSAVETLSIPLMRII